jgi:hypothetical protein
MRKEHTFKPENIYMLLYILVHNEDEKNKEEECHLDIENDDIQNVTYINMNEIEVEIDIK